MLKKLSAILMMGVLLNVAPAEAATKKRAATPVAKKTVVKKAPAKPVAKRRGKARVRRAVKRKWPVMPKFKAYELKDWPQLGTLQPTLALEFPPPPNLPKNCPLCGTQLLQTAYSLIGTRYVLGGTRPETGFDCSGFVRYVYEMNFPVSLPPSAPTQYRVGMSVNREELEPGDLVFFRTRRGWHVGMYVGDDNFIHAPNRRKTVSVSPLFSDAYWRRAYVGARRIELPETVEAGAGN